MKCLAWAVRIIAFLLYGAVSRLLLEKNEYTRSLFDSNIEISWIKFTLIIGWLFTVIVVSELTWLAFRYKKEDDIFNSYPNSDDIKVEKETFPKNPIDFVQPKPPLEKD